MRRECVTTSTRGVFHFTRSDSVFPREDFRPVFPFSGAVIIIRNVKIRFRRQIMEIFVNQVPPVGRASPKKYAEMPRLADVFTAATSKVIAIYFFSANSLPSH